MPRRPKTPEQIEHDRICREMHLQMIRDFQNAENREEYTTEELFALLLSFSMRKCDYKAEAAELLKRYGSFRNITDMAADVLMMEPSIRLNTALMLKGIPALVQQKMFEERPKRKRIKTPQDAEAYLKPYFIGTNYEEAYLLILSDYYYPKDVVKLGAGTGSEVYISIQMVLRELYVHRCNKAILAHSHPTGDPIPSSNDKLVTLEIANRFQTYSFRLLDHLIFTKKDCCYLSEDKEMDHTVLEFSQREHVSIFKK
jgi:DNA repair protein RadC